MTTAITKPVRRKTETTRRDRGKQRRYIVTLYPGDTIGLRLEKCRSEEILPIGLAYEMATRLRIADEREKKRVAKKNGTWVKRGKL